MSSTWVAASTVEFTNPGWDPDHTDSIEGPGKTCSARTGRRTRAAGRPRQPQRQLWVA